jgi:hypothetical protein
VECGTNSRLLHWVVPIAINFNDQFLKEIIISRILLLYTFKHLLFIKSQVHKFTILYTRQTHCVFPLLDKNALELTLQRANNVALLWLHLNQLGYLHHTIGFVTSA